VLGLGTETVVNAYNQTGQQPKDLVLNGLPSLRPSGASAYWLQELDRGWTFVLIQLLNVLAATPAATYVRFADTATSDALTRRTGRP
jgi:hypothetical protein